MDETLLWDIRAFVYRHFANTTRPPSVEESAQHFGLTLAEVAAAYEELQRRHALFLNPGTSTILMANPFSGVETPFKVYANNKTYFANCAWDSLGIPAALQVDAAIEASCAQTEDLIRLEIGDQQIQSSNALVHFLIPFRNWYDDLVFT
jgi:DNA-binding transcriptional MocR family regulator